MTVLTGTLRAMSDSVFLDFPKVVGYSIEKALQNR